MQYKIEKYDKGNTDREGEKVVKGVRNDICVSSYDVEYVKNKIEA